MTSKEALEEIEDWVEYFTRLDYVEPIVRGEVQQKFKDAYWGTLEHFEKIEKDLDILEILKEYFKDYHNIIKLLNTYEGKDEYKLLEEWLNDK